MRDFQGWPEVEGSRFQRRLARHLPSDATGVHVADARHGAARQVDLDGREPGAPAGRGAPHHRPGAPCRRRAHHRARPARAARLRDSPPTRSRGSAPRHERHRAPRERTRPALRGRHLACPAEELDPLLPVHLIRRREDLLRLSGEQHRFELQSRSSSRSNCCSKSCGRRTTESMSWGSAFSVTKLPSTNRRWAPT